MLTTDTLGAHKKQASGSVDASRLKGLSECLAVRVRPRAPLRQQLAEEVSERRPPRPEPWPREVRIDHPSGVGPYRPRGAVDPIARWSAHAINHPAPMRIACPAPDAVAEKLLIIVPCRCRARVPAEPSIKLLLKHIGSPSPPCPMTSRQTPEGIPM